METLLKQLRELPSRLLALPTFARRSLLGGVAALLVLAVGITWLLRSGDGYQYAFTNLSADDGSEAAGHLSAVGIPFRLEANGTALAVPSEHLHEARLLLASAGLPKGGGVGFELFDRGDIGVSEFTQRVNLRRAIEGELARTIGSLAEVRSARVHVTLEDKGLYRDNDRAAAASVVLNLHPGRVLGDRELAGIRHLVAAAVPGLRAEGVTIVDGKGSVLGPGDSYGSAFAAVQRDIERDLERRIISILEPAVGPGAAVARVTATLETTESSMSSEIYDPDRAAVRTERRMSQSQESDRSLAAGVAGAAANQPGRAAAAAPQTRNTSTTEDENRTYEISKTVTTSVQRSPRILRLSVAVVIDGLSGQPRSDAELARLGNLVRRAVGFDASRGDQIEVSSFPFNDGSTPPDAEAPPLPFEKPVIIGVAAVLAALAFLAGLLLLTRRRRRTRQLPAAAGTPARELPEELVGSDVLPESPLTTQSLPDPNLAIRDRARELASQDPVQAARLLRAWLAADEAETEMATNE